MRAKYWLSVSMFRTYMRVRKRGPGQPGSALAYARAWAIGNIADGRSAILLMGVGGSRFNSETCRYTHADTRVGGGHGPYASQVLAERVNVSRMRVRKRGWAQRLCASVGNRQYCR